jgi:hypothetical protein
MTHDCWLHQLRRLRTMYGEKAFPEERVRLLAKELSPLTDRQLGNVVDDIIANLNHAPTLKDFIKVAEPMLKAHAHDRELAFDRSVDERRKNGQSCWYCDDVGTISAIDTTNVHAGTFSFGCPDASCMAREFRAPTFVKWSEHLEPRFRPCFVGQGKTAFQVWREIFKVTGGGPVQDKDWPRIINNLAAAKERDDDLPPAG